MRNKLNRNDILRPDQRRRARNMVAVALAAGAGFCCYSVVFFFVLQPQELAPVKQGGMHVLHALAKEIRPLPSHLPATPVLTASNTPLPPPVAPEPPKPGFVVVTLAGRGQLWIDGERLTKTVRSQTIELPPGAHVVMLQRGNRLQSQKVTVQAGGQAHVDFSVPPDLRHRSEGREDAPQAEDGPNEE